MVRDRRIFPHRPQPGAGEIVPLEQEMRHVLQLSLVIRKCVALMGVGVDRDAEATCTVRCCAAFWHSGLSRSESVEGIACTAGEQGFCLP